jgi:hypothetical protein
MRIANRQAGRNWRRVSSKTPCPICKHSEWCCISGDGALAKCMRVAEGAWKTGTQTDGATYHLHRLGGDARPQLPPAQPPGPGTPRAAAEVLHRAYSALLARLQLSASHRQALRGRGLSDAEIDRRGYRTLPVQGRARLAGELREQQGDGLLSVPGFVVKQGESGRPYVTIAGAAGLLVPVRDTAGNVVALLVRRDDATRGPRYSYLSSAKCSGPGPGTPAHVPLGVTAPCPVCRLTEGALKADVAMALSGLPTIGAAGLAWRPALDILQALSCGTVRLAFDADALDKPPVARALAACAEGLAAAGLAVELERWPAEHKGIDDLLAAGKTAEVLTGEAALAAIREAVAAATAGEPAPAPDELERLAEVLDAGGAAALFADAPLLRALARLADAEPAAFVARRATLKGLVSLRDLDAALKPYLRDLARQRPPVLLAAAGYRVADGCIVRQRMTQDGPVEVPLCNFTARITEAVTRDDGAEQATLFTLAGSLADGCELPAVSVSAADFAGLGWVTATWHGRAVVYAGQGTRDHLRAALELLSRERTERTVYGHTGWRQIGDHWHYLHAGGAIGPDGPAVGVEVSLPDPLAGFALPAPPQDKDLARAVGASLALLGGLAPDRLTFPLLGAAYRAALGEAPGPIDLSLHLSGPHGAGKTEMAALAQQHFGAGLDARHLPGSWSSTANAIEELAFAAKDALLVVDDYAPRGAAGDRQRLEKEADRLFRAQGNRAGRQRMRRDSTLRPAKPPRGLFLSTGEDVPAGHSLRGRLLVLEVSPGDVPLARLTPHQRAAAAGLFAQALAGFVRWLAPHYAELCARLPGERVRLRDRAQAEIAAGSARTPGIMADLALGLQLFLDFARAVGVLTAAARETLARRGWQALAEACAAQAAHVQAAEPTVLFLRLLVAAVASGQAHVAGVDGQEPKALGKPREAAAWGWWGKEYTTGGPDGRETHIEWQAKGRRIGWVDGAELYLEPEASYAAAQEMARNQGDSLPVQARTLHKRLKERGLLASTDPGREVLTVRRTLEGRRRNVLHLRADTLSQEPDQPDQPDHTPANAGENGRVAGRVCPDPAGNPTSEPDQKARENGPLVGLVGLVGFPAGEGASPADDESAEAQQPGSDDGYTPGYDPGF